MRLIDADALKNHLEDLRSYTMLGEECLYYDGETNALSVAIQNIDNALTVDAVPVKCVITALMDLRDAFVAKQPRSEWYKDKTAQGVEKGIEMCIARIREMAKDD